MTKPPPSKWLRPGLAALLTAAIAFSAGIWVAGSHGPDTSPPPTAAVARPSPSQRPLVRNPYSTTIRRDPYVLDRQRLIVEAMETRCRTLNQGCAEATAARRYLDRQMADD